VIVVFVVYSALAYVIHNVILAPDYATMSAALRSESAFLQRMPVLYLGNLIFALAFCLIYAKGYEPGKGWLGQGLRFGLMVGTLLAPFALTEYVIYPVPGGVALQWIVYGYAQVIVTAVFAAALYQLPSPRNTY
jgi:membrane-bound ClpP family serine protease